MPWVLLAAVNLALASAGSFTRAVQLLRDGDAVQAELEINALRASGERPDALQYLWIRLQLLRRDGAAAVAAAEQMLIADPRSPFAEFARYARAEGNFLRGNRAAALQDLRWVAEHAADARLVAQAQRVLGEMRDEPIPSPAAGPAAIPAHGYGEVVLLLSFTWPGDADADLLRSFRFAAARANPQLTFDVIQTGSAFEAAAACEGLMQRSDMVLLVFAGDEAAAAPVALMSAQYRVPALKISGGSRPSSRFSPYFFEFLPSGEMQAAALGEFAVRYWGIDNAMALFPDDAFGRAQAEGFRAGLNAAGGNLEAAISYSPELPSIRKDLERALTNELRLARGGAPLFTALSAEERAMAFGDSTGGEVLYLESAADSLRAAPPDPAEVLFISVHPDRLDAYAGQVTLPSGATTLLGNSSWINEDVLARYNSATERMFIVAPILPEGLGRSPLLDAYIADGNGAPSDWELLGLDAGDYVGRIMSGDAVQRGTMVDIIAQSPVYTGGSVTVDFAGGRENRAAHILQYVNYELQVVR